MVMLVVGGGPDGDRGRFPCHMLNFKKKSFIACLCRKEIFCLVCFFYRSRSALYRWSFTQFLLDYYLVLGHLLCRVPS